MKKGDCFKANYDALLTKPFNKGWFLCHGVVTGTAGPVKNLQYVHAWLEHGDIIYDYSNGAKLVMPRALYYMMGRIEKVVRYNSRQALLLAIRYKTYGCWDEMFNAYP